MFWCIVPLVVFAVAVFAIRRSTSLPTKARLIYLLTFALEIPGAIIRFPVGAVIGSVLLLPLWIIFGFITVVAAGITLWKYHNPTIGVMIVGLPLSTLGGLIVGLVALAVAFGPVVWSVLCVLGLRGGHSFTRFS